jgi:hypothetical protein
MGSMGFREVMAEASGVKNVTAIFVAQIDG